MVMAVLCLNTYTSMHTHAQTSIHDMKCRFSLFPIEIPEWQFHLSTFEYRKRSSNKQLYKKLSIINDWTLFYVLSLMFHILIPFR